MEKKYADLLGVYGNYEINVTTGVAWKKILKRAKEKRTDIIMLGPHFMEEKEKNRAPARKMVGSTIEGVIRREHRPVMTVNRTLPEEKMRFRSVIVSIDFSRSCSYALRHRPDGAGELGIKSHCLMGHTSEVLSSSRFERTMFSPGRPGNFPHQQVIPLSK